MKQKLIMFATLLTVLATSLFFTGCTNDDNNSRPVMYSFSTYVSSGAGSSMFLYTIGTTGPDITLMATNASLPATTFTPGSRVVIAFQTANDSLPTVSQNIELIGAAPAMTLVPRPVNIADSANWAANSINVTYMQLNGGYINMEAGLQAQTISDGQFLLLLDQSTADSDFPQLYLTNYIPQSPYQPSNTLYASFDIRSLWQRPTCKGLVVNVNNSNNQFAKAFTFEKK